MTTLNLGRAVLYGVDGNPVNAFAAGAGATDTVIPLALVNDPTTGVTLSANMQGMLVGSYVQFLTGQNKGAFAQITGAAANSVTVEALAHAPDQGDVLIIHRIGQSVAEWGGTAVTGRDITSDIQRLQNLDLAITALRDALRGVDSRTLTDLYNYLARYSQLPTSLTTAGNLKTSTEEQAIAVGVDVQARYNLRTFQSYTPSAVGTFWFPTTGYIDLSDFSRSAWAVYAPTTTSMVINCYLNVSFDGGTTFRRCGKSILDASFQRDQWNILDVPEMLALAKLEIVIETAYPASLEAAVVRKA